MILEPLFFGSSQLGVLVIAIAFLNASNEELGLKAQNTWAFTSNSLMDEWL